jgi:hypothetical protein
VHEFYDFIKRFAEADHDSAFGQHASAFAIAPSGGTLQQSHRLLVDGVGSDTAVKTRDRFSIVIEYVGFGVEYGVECRFVSVKVWNENLDFAIRIQGTDLSNGLSPVSGATIRQIVSID